MQHVILGAGPAGVIEPGHKTLRSPSGAKNERERGSEDLPAFHAGRGWFMLFVA